MGDQFQTISFIEAKKLAEEAARINLSIFLSDPSIDLLRDEYLETEYCWMFFRNQGIIVPPEGSLRGDWAYAVSKRGQIRQIADLSDDPIKLNAYLIKMSDYFNRQPN